MQAQPQDYAAAIYELALENWTRQLGNVQKALRLDPELNAAVQDPTRPTNERLALLEGAAPDGLSADVRGFLGTLIDENQLSQLDAIMVEFEQLARRRPERRMAQVTSAVPLTDGERDALREKVLERFGQDIEFQFGVDEKLLGGILLRVGDQVIDGTVAGKLAALRDQLAA
jgi:F-type H+-transporting ATPase subunit delta